MPILATPQTCTGCAACGNICPHNAITMSPDNDGFIMPKINPDRCVECKLCEKACPIVNGKDLKNPEIKEVYAFWDNETRTESSSGGAFSAIARWIRKRGGFVFGAAWIDGFQCLHRGCGEDLDISPLRGSKYLQSDIRKTYVEACEKLKEGKYVLFTGTPCQIAGLRSFLIKPYERLITVDIVCHGVPSNSLFSNYIEKLKKEYTEYSSAVGFEFRNLRGWGIAPGLKRVNRPMKPLIGVPNLYMAAFEKGAIFRNSCYDCHFNGLSRVGDITIADFWGIGALGIPFKQDITKGVSLILTNSEIGKSIVKELQDCFIEKREIKEAVRLNKNLVTSTDKPPYRDELIKAFNNPELSLHDINCRFHIIGTGFKDHMKNLLISTGMFWVVKSIINKLRCI